MAKPDQPIEEKKAYQLILRSQSHTSIKELKPLTRSLLFAELSMISYLAPKEAEKASARLGYTETIFYNNDGSQAYSFANERDIVIACRGTEPNEWNDIKADINAGKALAETVGRVHRGFKQEVDDLWPLLERMLAFNIKRLWFTGHSLGGAMASICAGRCQLSRIDANPEQLCTFGSPRVGNKRYINHAKVDFLRWVNNNDIVTRSPPAWLRYRHTGKEMYLDSGGELKTLTKAQRSRDAWKGFFMGLKKREIDHFADHSIYRYVKYIFKEAVAQGELRSTGNG